MKIYARIDGGKVAEIIEPFADEEGNEVPIASRFHPDIVTTLVDITGTDVEAGWSYADGVFAQPTPAALSREELIAANIDAVEAEMNRQAALKFYDNIKSAALRAGYPGPFHDEGVAYATWMDECYALAYTVLGQVNAGTRPMPTPEESVAMMPPLVLP
jgi:hypothetical protein